MDLYEASRMGDILASYEALARGANVNWINMLDGDKSSLHMCAANAGSIIGEEDDQSVDHTCVLQMKTGSPLTRTKTQRLKKISEDGNNESPIELLLGSNHMQWIECAELLILNGANRDVVDNNGLTPLDCAATVGSNEDMVHLLSS